METLYDFFAKPKDPKRYNGIRLALASPEAIRNGRTEKSKSRRPSTIERLNPSAMAFFALKSLAL